jgi:hypothetical protein
MYNANKRRANGGAIFENIFINCYYKAVAGKIATVLFL